MDLILLNAVPFAFALGLTIPGIRNNIPKSTQTWLTSAVMFTLFMVLLGYLPDIRQSNAITRHIDWMPELGLELSIYLDGLALLFALIITGVGAIIFLYTGYYFDDFATQTRFNIQMMAFTGAMLGVVLAGNLITMFIMWELTSITSFLLIGFKGDKDESARAGAMKALVITGGGGLALLAGLLLMAIATGDGAFHTDWREILKTTDLASHPWYNAITILMMFGAFTKSAQWPFHFWLPGAMAAPTPASAFLHSATMVKAGIYLLARLYPVLGNTALWTNALLGIGLTTMFLGALFAIRQRDLKGLLAYTTISQLGAFVALVGMPDGIGIKAALVGILAHALYKAALFLIVGTIDHTMGTRIIDQLGGVAKFMPVTTIIGVISALSMAGLPFLFGFVAKETLIAAAIDAPSRWLVTSIVVGSAVFMSTAAFILIWDVFFRRPSQELHVHHAMSRQIDLGPGVLASGSLSLGFLLHPIIIPLIEPAVKKSFKLELFPGFITEFYLSLGAILMSLVVFGVRRYWLAWRHLPLRGDTIYNGLIQRFERVGDQLLRLQNGKVRHYIIIITGVVAAIVLGSGLLADLTAGEDLWSHLIAIEFTSRIALELMLLILVVGSAFGSIIVRRHLYAVLALGVMGYGVAGLFLVRQAVDVAFVQFMVETLATVLLVIILSRTNIAQRQRVMNRLWVGVARGGLWRDLIIASIAGFSVFIFAAIALVNRPERDTIAQWHIENVKESVGATDIVAGILTDFRGMDTLIEITVFTVAAIGILVLLSLNREHTQKESQAAILATQEIREKLHLATPFTRGLAMFILPLAMIISISHTVYGAYAPGDGFTAGVISGLAIALWYIVLGYNDVRRRLTWLHPVRFISTGLALAFINAALPLLWGDGFMAYNKIPSLSLAGITLSSTLIFEVGIALTVLGSVGIMLEAVAHPRDVESLEETSEEKEAST